VGIGVHSGPTLVGVVGNAQGVNQISVLGDAANTTARLAAEAQTGEIIVSAAAAQAAGLDTQGLMPRELQLKGKQAPFKAWSLRPEPASIDR
jgi:class 3 adenylate cyclase